MSYDIITVVPIDEVIHNLLYYADVAKLADALDLGSSVYDVQVQVLSSANTYIS